jgi:endoglucanase
MLDTKISFCYFSMRMLLLLLILTFPLALTAQTVLSTQPKGMNLTGNERVWDFPVFKPQKVIKEIQDIRRAGISIIRLPLAFGYFESTDARFYKKLRKVIRYSNRKNTALVLAYFDHGLTEDNLHQKKQELISHWYSVLDIIPANATNLFLEIVNEPTISPDSWRSLSLDILMDIRKKNPAIPLIVGATNSNSIFELSRMDPFPVDGLIYTFHYYEPFIFTHQGTEWTGDQHATTGIPYPFHPSQMPQLHPDAYGTDGEINFRDYDRTGNHLAVEDKIAQIASWASRHSVVVWCTEFGVTIHADELSRKAYLEDVIKTLAKYQISSIVWEWEGNFGTKNLFK